MNTLNNIVNVDKPLSHEELIVQRDNILKYISLNNLIEFFPLGFIILNSSRQIVYHNKNFNILLGNDINYDYLGKTPGQAFNCNYSDIDPNGCGCSEFCKECNASKSIIKAFYNSNSIGECNILSKNSKALNLTIHTYSFIVKGDKFIFCAIKDNSEQKYKEMLERLFFHDILNTLNSLKGITDIIKEHPDEIDEFNTILQNLTSSLIDQIHSQKQLLQAENDTLAVKISNANSSELISAIIYTYKNIAENAGINLYVDSNAKEIALNTDINLAQRVLGNMLKNAIEASKSGNSIKIDCQETIDTVDFSIHNESVIPREVQLQLFQRTFSTKGTGRGLGTYSMKLLMEKYLNGKISFISKNEVGTIFTASFPK